MISQALWAAASDLLTAFAILAFALVIALLYMQARWERKHLPDPTELESEAEVIEAFSQFPEPWRPEAHSRLDDSDRRAA